MSCERLTLSWLLSNKDVTTISVLIGSNVGSFLLGSLLALFILRRLTNNRSRPKQTQPISPTRRTSFIKIRPESTLYEQPVASKLTTIDNLHSGTVPMSPCSLSHTFVRHSLKPPMNMFNSSLSTTSGNHSKSTARRMEHPLMVINDNTASGRRPSESDISTVYGGMSMDNGPEHFNNTANFNPVDAASTEKRRSIGGSSVSRDLSRRQSQSTYTSDSKTAPFQIPIAGASAVQEPVVSTAIKETGSYREYPTRPKRASTKYDVNYPLTRQRTLSSNSLVARPELGEARPSLSTSIGEGSPKLRIMHPFSSNVTFEDDAIQRAELERQLSDRQQAASFYQEHATRHLSLPQGAQLMTSPVLPESPSIIGGGDRNDFSFARGQPSKLR